MRRRTSSPRVSRGSARRRRPGCWGSSWSRRRRRTDAERVFEEARGAHGQRTHPVPGSAPAGRPGRRPAARRAGTRGRSDRRALPRGRRRAGRCAGGTRRRRPSRPPGRAGSRSPRPRSFAGGDRRPQATGLRRGAPPPSRRQLAGADRRTLRLGLASRGRSTRPRRHTQPRSRQAWATRLTAMT